VALRNVHLSIVQRLKCAAPFKKIRLAISRSPRLMEVSYSAFNRASVTSKGLITMGHSTGTAEA
jgi:hypothetical protein